MLFTSGLFPLFFCVVVVVHACLDRNDSRKNWLLASSAVFYALWDWRFLWLIAAATVSEFYLAFRIDSSQDARRRFWWRVSLAKNLLLLFTFKYLGFFSESVSALVASFGFRADGWVASVALPVGISFYTFELIAYATDVHRRRVRPETSLRDFALYVFFFPRLVSGPILRPAEFLPQLKMTREPASSEIRSAIGLFFLGLTKKLLIADNLGVVIDEAFELTPEFSAYAGWFAVLAFPVQLYCDFSGYSDMARGCARALGYELPVNFRSPFLSLSTTEFWQRWHISLSSWVRDYLYLPWRGVKPSLARRDFCLVICMVAMGAWHGAAWGYVIFGVVGGLGLWIQKRWSEWGKIRLPPFLAMTLTYLTFALSLVPFRAKEAGKLISFLEALSTGSMLTVPLSVQLGLAFWLVFLVLHLLWPRLAEGARNIWLRWPSWVLGSASGFWLSFLFGTYASGQHPFIYFQF